MKKMILAVIAAVAFVLGGVALFWGMSSTEAAQVSAEALFPGMQVNTLDSKDGNLLVGVSEPQPVDSSPDFLGSELYLIDRSFDKKLVDTDVVSAKFLTDMDIIYMARGSLLRWNHGNGVYAIAEQVESDFAVSPDEREIVFVRHDTLEEVSQLFRLELGDTADHVPVIASGDGTISWPLYTPDGAYLLFVAAFDGVVSWYRVDLNAPQDGVVQITNKGLKPGVDVLSDAFVPVPRMLESLKFVDDRTIEYDTGEGVIQLDIMTGTLIGG
ncbi:MAG: hypothetical protein IKY83_03665 [Proteobacteria bacterium]|nr:hypothetical protein [Pseudomonadota bacterium]